MARRGPTLIYVHGAGGQPPEADWIRIHNQILFHDRPAPATDLAYYADLIKRVELAAAPMNRPRRHESPGADARKTPLTGTPASTPWPSTPSAEHVLANSIHESVAAEGRTHEAHLFLLRLAAAMGPTDHRSRFALPGHVIPPAVRDFYREVSGYLHGTPGLADDMRARVRSAILRTDGALVIVAHSLGSVIAFDVLGEPELIGRGVQLITAGSPLGLGPVQDHLRAWRGSRPIEIPSGAATWRSFQAAGDPVAVGTGLDDLRGDYAPPLRVHATEVRNEAEWHHALTGYLDTPEVRDSIYARLTDRPRHLDRIARRASTASATTLRMIAVNCFGRSRLDRWKAPARWTTRPLWATARNWRSPARIVTSPEPLTSTTGPGYAASLGRNDSPASDRSASEPPR